MDTLADRASETAEGVRHAVEDGYRRTVEGASEAYEAAADTVDRGYRQARAGVESTYRRADWQTRRAGAEVSRYVNDNPVMVGVIGFAGGLLLGALLPWGRRSNGGGNESYANRYREAAYSQGDHHRSGYSGGYGPYPFTEDRPGDYR
ncbi:hypothetical protein [Microbaculum marinum]|uniref:DUF883 domain-containing protein n=1 Tax=Microbaculum marinum TaxID=1764581 RepID=A0AAW9RM46_9HYPH